MKHDYLHKVEWLKKRKLALKRDGYTCQSCGSKNELQVHHLVYIKTYCPSKVPLHYLICLCRDCHKHEHDINHISTYVFNSYKDVRLHHLKLGKRSRNFTKVKRKKKNKYNLSKKDLELSRRYEKHRKK